MIDVASDNNGARRGQHRIAESRKPDCIGFYSRRRRARRAEVCRITTVTAEAITFLASAVVTGPRVGGVWVTMVRSVSLNMYCNRLTTVL